VSSPRNSTQFPLLGVLLGIALLVSGLGPSQAPAAEFDKFGFSSASAELTTHEAGAHPDFTTILVTKTDSASATVNGEHFPYAALRDVAVELPPGLIGNLNAVDQCSNSEFVLSKTGEGRCPFSSQVGISEVRLLGSTPGVYAKSPIFKLETTDEDNVARFGFMVLTVPVYINVRLRSDSDYGVTAEVANLAAATPILEVITTLWGVPAASSHDNLRLTPQEVFETKQESPPRSAEHPLEPFLSNPTTCGGPLAVGIAADSYQEPGRFVRTTAPLGEITGCNELDFEPSLSLAPTTREAATPSGMDVLLTIPQHEEFDERTTSHLRDAVVRLPDGMTVSPGTADGLTACSVTEVGYQVSPSPPARCPEASRLATAVIESPSLARPIKGAVYQRAPEPGRLFRVWLVTDELGVHAKIPGEFKLDQTTGRITSLFLDAPQLPIRSLELHFKGGPRGVLSTPRSCGSYLAEYTLTPWSGRGDVAGANSMNFDQNCATGGFAPGLKARSLNPKGGAFSPLFVSLTQASGEQNLSRLRVTMPPGVLAKLKGVGLCPEPATSTGACPASSLVGRSVAATGFGPNPLWIPQPGKSPTAVYLAGPYQGGPYSLVVKTPAEAGPFDLGDVVVRVALQVNPGTAQVTAVSDPLPQILEGVPLTYRDIRIELDRPEFALNPTSCDPMTVNGTASSAGGANSDLSTRFQVVGCSALPFKPKLKLSLKGETLRAGNPALTANLRMPRRGANVAWTRVILPRSLQIDNAHINNPCTRVQFDAGSCPKKSILGRATAFTPLLASPLRGPVYFRSNGGERELPDLVVDLRGPIHVVLVGYIDSKKKRIRTTFAQVPDAPVRRFSIRLFSGKRGLLENNRNLCATRSQATLQFNGQNGKVADSTEALAVSCREKQS
jgi:hypothetical protein